MKTFSVLGVFLFSAWLPASAETAAKSGSLVSAAIKPYALETCIVTDSDLGSMGDERRIVYEGQEIKFCCKPCEARFLKNPARYLKKLAPAAPPSTPAP